MIFIGDEKEGRYKGLKTLFVGGLHNLREVFDLAEKHSCEHIYLGAGRTYSHGLSQKDIKFLLQAGFKLSLETTYNPHLDKEIYPQINCIYTILMGSFPLDLSWLCENHCIKIEDDNKLFIMPVSESITTILDTLKDNMYEGDIVLKE